MDGARLLDGPLRVDVLAVFDIPASWSKKKRGEALAGRVWPTGRADIDNVLKAPLDAFNGIVWNDDKQVVVACIKNATGCQRFCGLKYQRLEIHNECSLPAVSRPPDKANRSSG